MPKLKPGKPYIKKFTTCLEALKYIDSLLTKKNKSGRLNNSDGQWLVRYTRKENDE